MHPEKRRPGPAGGRVAGAKTEAVAGDRSPQGSSPQPQLQHLACHLAQLGERAVYEFILELATTFGADVTDRLEAYGRIDPSILRAIGGDRFPPHLVEVPR